MKFEVDNDEWKLLGDFQDTHPQMKISLEKYLNSIDAIFRKAKQAQECEFILALLSIRGLQAPGWDLFEGIDETFKALDQLRIKNKKNYHGIHTTYLFMYGLILESDPLYELLANLLNIAEGERFKMPGANFPDIVHPNGKVQSVPPVDKINQLKNRAKRLGMDLSLFDDFYDKDLRNALFHSDYVLYNNEIRLPNFHFPKVYKNEEWVILTNNAMAYYQALTHLRKYHVSLYDEPKRIKPHPEMVHNQNEEMFIIVRKKHGVIGMKDTFSQEEIRRGAIPHSIGRFYPYEQKLIKEGELFMPAYKEPLINKIYRFSPRWIKKIILKFHDKKIS